MPYGFEIICPPVPPPPPAPPPQFALAPAGATLPIEGIAYSPTLGVGQGMFACVAAVGVIGNRIMTSVDSGQNWTIQPASPLVTWEKVVWASALGLFVCCGRTTGPNRIATSPDGITWTGRATPALLDFFDIAWNSTLGLLAVVGGAAGAGVGNHIITSPDGINWTARVAPIDNFWTAIGAGPVGGVEGFVAVAGNLSGALNRIMTSTDGIAWTIRGNPLQLNFTGVSFSPTLGLWAAVGTSFNNGMQIATSPDGVAWTARATPLLSGVLQATRVKWSPLLSQFIACVGNSTTIFTGNRFWRSLDGITWTAFTSPADVLWRDIVDSGAPANKVIIMSGSVPHFAISQ